MPTKDGLPTEEELVTMSWRGVDGQGDEVARIEKDDQGWYALFDLIDGEVLALRRSVEGAKRYWREFGNYKKPMRWRMLTPIEQIAEAQAEVARLRPIRFATGNLSPEEIERDIALACDYDNGVTQAQQQLAEAQAEAAGLRALLSQMAEALDETVEALADAQSAAGLGKRGDMTRVGRDTLAAYRAALDYDGQPCARCGVEARKHPEPCPMLAAEEGARVQAEQDALETWRAGGGGER